MSCNYFATRISLTPISAKLQMLCFIYLKIKVGPDK